MLAVALLACGGGQSAAPAAQGTAAKSAGPPAMPSDPLALLPAGPRELASADLAQLRASRHFAALDRLARTYGCFTPAPDHFFFERTDRALVASYGAAADDPAAKRLVVLRGRYIQGDARRALDEANTLLLAASQAAASPDAAAPSEQTRGRFHVVQRGALSSVQLGDNLLALGDTQAVLDALAVADGERPALSSKDALVPGIDNRQWLEASGHTFAVLTRVDAQSAARLGRQLGPIGGRRLGEGLGDSTAAGAIVFSSELTVRGQVLYADPNSAASAAEALRSVIGRAGFVLRLTGMPPALERTQVTSDGARMHIALTVTEAEVRDTLEQVEPFLQREAKPCATQARAPASGASAPVAAESH